MKKSVPLEEALKIAKQNMIVQAEADERRRIKENKDLEDQLSHLRENISIETLDFNNQKALVSSFTNKDYLEQMITLEKAIESETIAPQEMINLFQNTHNNKTRLAIIESLPKFKQLDPKQQYQCLEFLSQIAANYFSDPEQIEIEFNLNNREGSYLQKYRIDYEDEADYDLITSVSINSLTSFGQVAEEHLTKVFETRRKHSLDEQKRFDEDTEIKKERIADEEDYDDGLFDDRGRIADHEDKSFADMNYCYNAKVLYQLSEIGSEKSIDFIIDFIREDSSAFFIYHEEILNILKINKEHSLNRLLLSIDKDKLKEPQIYNMILSATDIAGAEETRAKLNKLIAQEEHREEKGEVFNQGAIDNLERARFLITPNDKRISVERMEIFYKDKAKLETYGTNKIMTPKEVPLLKSLISPKQKTLEIGMGTGRLFLELKDAEYDITGYDYTPENITHVKEISPSAKIFRGDWKNNALQSESFDAVYSLGRNILHEYSLPDQVQMFREAARILKKSGKFIFDIPTRDKGEYKERVEDYAYLMENEFHIHNYRRGAIYDSMDGKHFSSRYAYSNEDIENLAQLAGFRIIEVRREELPTGKGDENLYYVLEKI